MKKYIAYKGTKFIIEWYFDSKGNSHFLELDEDFQDKYYDKE
jgi:hypothetical protein